VTDNPLHLSKFTSHNGLFKVTQP